jgi:hypothetical protein
MKHDIYTGLVKELNNDFEWRCDKCRVLVGALSKEALQKAIERHKCKKVKK